MIDFGSLTIGGILLSGIVVALVELAKRNGLPSQYAPWLNLVLTTAAVALFLFTQQKPEYLSLVTIALQVLQVFLIAAGVYTTSAWALKTSLGTKEK